jgi:anaphase-promoting complex subunit 6
MVYHLLDDVDRAIVKYHEVCRFLSRLSVDGMDFTLQALSIDPINPHMIELLNLALESSVSLHAFAPHAFPGGEQAFEKTMKNLRAKVGIIMQRDAAVGKGKQKETERDMDETGSEKMRVG